MAGPGWPGRDGEIHKTNKAATILILIGASYKKEVYSPPMSTDSFKSKVFISLSGGDTELYRLNALAGKGEVTPLSPEDYKKEKCS